PSSTAHGLRFEALPSKGPQATDLDDLPTLERTPHGLHESINCLGDDLPLEPRLRGNQVNDVRLRLGQAPPRGFRRGSIRPDEILGKLVSVRKRAISLPRDILFRTPVRQDSFFVRVPSDKSLRFEHNG